MVIRSIAARLPQRAAFLRRSAEDSGDVRSGIAGLFRARRSEPATARAGFEAAARVAHGETGGLACQGLVKTFPGASEPVLKNVSLSIRSNEFFTLLGPSGCGKTTLLRLIAGLETLDQGTIALSGERIDRLPAFKRPVNTVFQSYAMFPHLTVAGNIGFGLQAKRWPAAKIATKVAEMLALVRLQGLENRRPGQLSGGQQQRVALARALANEPSVLLLDEPLSALDLKLRTEMQLELKRIQAKLGITFVFVTHDQQEALAMSDRIAVMRDGEILQLGTPQEIYETPTSRFVADFIGETNLLDAVRVGADRFALSSGAELTAQAPAGIAIGDAVALAIRPEHASLVPPGEGLFAGSVTDVVYLGSDRVYHLTLDDGTVFRLRETNGGTGRSEARRGDRVGVAVAPDAVRVLP